MVAFEADSLDIAVHVGWSDTAIGPSQAVADKAEIRRLRDIGLCTWAPGDCEHFIQITPQILNGRRLRAHRDTAEPEPQAYAVG